MCVVRAEHEFLATVGKPHGPTRRQRVVQRAFLVGRDLDQPRPAGAAAAAAEMHEAVAGDAAEHEEIARAD